MLNENKETEGRHKNYLIKKRLDYCLWQNINFLIKLNLRKYSRFILNPLFVQKIFIFQTCFKNFILNKRNLSNIKELSNLKYIIVGHEELIPLNIQVSALLNDIKIISYQTRSKFSHFTYFFLVIISRQAKNSENLTKKNNLILLKVKVYRLEIIKRNK